MLYFLFNKFYIMKYSPDSIEVSWDIGAVVLWSIFDEFSFQEKKSKSADSQIEIHDVSKRKSNGHLKQKDEPNGEVNQAFESCDVDICVEENATHRRNSYNAPEQRKRKTSSSWT